MKDIKDTNYLSVWVKRFLLEYLINTRNLSKNTQQSYRDTFKLLLPCMASRSKKTIDKLLIDDISGDHIKAFLLSLENDRHCSLSTRNQRLAALHAFAKFVGLNSPELICQHFPVQFLKQIVVFFHIPLETNNR